MFFITIFGAFMIRCFAFTSACNQWIGYVNWNNIFLFASH